MQIIPTKAQNNRSVRTLAAILPMLAGWCRQRSFKRPVLEAVQQRRTRCETELSRPIGQEHRSSAECQFADAAPVSGLLTRRNPLAIIRIVWAVYVAAFDRVQGCRARSHVCEEGGKAVAPTLGHGDSASAVVGIRTATRVVATLFYSAPDFIFARVCSTVLQAASRCDVALQATAATRHLRIQSARVDVNDATAYASASPRLHGDGEDLRRAGADHCETPEGLARQIALHQMIVPLAALLSHRPR
jgi:hypothetical protein